MNIINLKMLSHPVNWGIVWVVLLLSTTAYALVHEHIMDMAGANNPD